MQSNGLPDTLEGAFHWQFFESEALQTNLRRLATRKIWVSCRRWQRIEVLEEFPFFSLETGGKKM